jgi:hypothetical protein
MPSLAAAAEVAAGEAEGAVIFREAGLRVVARCVTAVFRRTGDLEAPLEAVERVMAAALDRARDRRRAPAREIAAPRRVGGKTGRITAPTTARAIETTAKTISTTAKTIGTIARTTATTVTITERTRVTRFGNTTKTTMTIRNSTKIAGSTRSERV